MKSKLFSVVLSFCMLFPLSLPVEGQVSFFHPPTYSGSGNVFVADFNEDGKPDILTSDGTLNLGNGDGTFKLGKPVPSTVLAVADFNGDGKPDLLELGSGTLSVLLVYIGNGDGTFQAPISTPSGASLSSLGVADMNGDGKPDLVGLSGGSILVYVGKGDGTFAPAVSYPISINPLFLWLEDFNGDGKTDVALGTGDGPGQVFVFLGNGDGTLQTTPKVSATVNFPAFSLVGDFNGDGKLDIVIGSVPFKCVPNCYVYTLLGNGDGTFQSAILAFPAPYVGPIAAADLNGDGKLDVVFGWQAAQIYLGNGDGTFSNGNSYVASLANFENPLPPQTAVVSAIAIVDFNLDGKLDIAVSDVNEQAPALNVILLGKGGGAFEGIQVGPSCNLGVVGDFASTGTSEVAGVSGTSVCILINNGAGVLSLAHTYTLQQPGSVIVTGDFNGDGHLDLMVVGTDPATQDWEYSILLGNGDGSFQSPVYYPQNVITGVTAYSVVVADFNNDHKLDVAVAPIGSSVDGNLAILLGNGDGTFASPTYYYDAGFSPLLVADFNNDGKLDTAAGGTNPSPPNNAATVILYGNGNGTFQPAVFPGTLSNFAALFTADLNNDGQPDLLSGYQVALGNGDGTFTVLKETSALGIEAVADLNGDGKPDLVVGFQTGAEPTGVQLGNGDGTFGALINLVIGSAYIPTPILISDMNGDGRPDLIFNAGGGVDVLFNTTPAGFELTAGSLSPGTITAGSSATSTVTALPTFGFSSTVTLSCAALPSGATCGFSPAAIANGSGTSTLTIDTTASTAAGTYSVQVEGTSGSIVNNIPVSLVVQAPPDFTIGAASGSPTSQTISAGQTASFSLALAGTGSFTGTVSLSCAITPTVTPAPTCTLSSSSVQISGSGTQSVTVKVGTTAPMTTSVAPPVGFSSGPMSITWMLTLLGSIWLWLHRGRRRMTVTAPAMVLALALCVSCGGGGSSSHTIPGTPAGTYAATVTATSGSLSHNMALQVIVQ